MEGDETISIIYYEFFVIPSLVVNLKNRSNIYI